MWVEMFDKIGILVHECGLVSLFHDPIKAWGLTEKPFFARSVGGWRCNTFDLTPLGAHTSPNVRPVHIFFGVENIVRQGKKMFLTINKSLCADSR